MQTTARSYPLNGVLTIKMNSKNDNNSSDEVVGANNNNNNNALMWARSPPSSPFGGKLQRRFAPLKPWSSDPQQRKSSPGKGILGDRQKKKKPCSKSFDGIVSPSFVASLMDPAGAVADVSTSSSFDDTLDTSASTLSLVDECDAAVVVVEDQWLSSASRVTPNKQKGCGDDVGVSAKNNVPAAVAATTEVDQPQDKVRDVNKNEPDVKQRVISPQKSDDSLVGLGRRSYRNHQQRQQLDNIKQQQSEHRKPRRSKRPQTKKQPQQSHSADHVVSLSSLLEEASVQVQESSILCDTSGNNSDDDLSNKNVPLPALTSIIGTASMSRPPKPSSSSSSSGSGSSAKNRRRRGGRRKSSPGGAPTSLSLLSLTSSSSSASLASELSYLYGSSSKNNSNNISSSSGLSLLSSMSNWGESSCSSLMSIKEHPEEEEEADVDNDTGEPQEADAEGGGGGCALLLAHQQQHQQSILTLHEEEEHSGCELDGRCSRTSSISISDLPNLRSGARNTALMATAGPPASSMMTKNRTNYVADDVSSLGFTSGEFSFFGATAAGTGTPEAAVAPAAAAGTPESSSSLSNDAVAAAGGDRWSVPSAKKDVPPPPPRRPRR